MRLTDASVVIRPRNAWEAVDLGTLMAGRQQWLLVKSWLALTLPFFLVISLAGWRWPVAAGIVFWWLKPAFDRLPLYILSTSLFGAEPTVRQALRAWPAQARPNLIASLTWRRFSPWRSFYLPAVQLEGLKGKALSERLKVLGRQNAAHAFWLTLLGLVMQCVMGFAVWGLIYVMLPQHVEFRVFLNQIVIADKENSVVFQHFANFVSVFLIAYWEPIYVACGFSLYLNRRTVLEAWDIELVLRRLHQRLGGIAYALLLVFALVALPATQPAMADDDTDDAVASCPLPPDSETGPDSPHLLNQSLTSKASREAIEALVKKPPFTTPTVITQWFPDADQNKDKAAGKPPAWLLKWLLQNGNTGVLGLVAKSLEAVLWLLGILGIATLLWRYREWLATFVTRRPSRKKSHRETPEQLFGMPVSAASLPEDIAGNVERLWADQPREALGLLYRGLLYRLLSDFELPLKTSSTEAEVLALVNNLQQPALTTFSKRLTGHWQALAYGHQLPRPDLREALCADWRALFETRLPA